MDEAVKAGTLEVDGKIVVKTPTDWINENKKASAEAKSARSADDAANKGGSYVYDAGVELNVSKAAIEPVWYLPGEFSSPPWQYSCLMSVRQASPSDWGSPKEDCAVRCSRTREGCTPSYSLDTTSRLSCPLLVV